MTNPQYILVADSAYRTWETRENSANWYGRVLSWSEGSGKYIPTICTHGGSMWLCAGCAQAILNAHQDGTADTAF